MAQAYRNITRTLLFQKALVKYCRNIEKISDDSVFILYTYHLLGKESYHHPVSGVGKVMNHIDRKMVPDKLYKLSAELCAKGYLLQAGTEPIKYKLSMAGSNLLREVETMARKERWDR